MPKPRVVPSAAKRPNQCFLSKSDRGPFLDTGRDLPTRRKERLYLSLPYIQEALVGAGWIPPEEAKTFSEMKQKYEAMKEVYSSLQADHDEIVNTISQFVPPTIKKEIVHNTTYRQPTEEEISHWIRVNQGRYKMMVENHDREATNAWWDLNQKTVDIEKLPSTLLEGPARKVEKVEELNTGRQALVEEEGTTVDVIELLTHSVPDVLSFAQGKSMELLGVMLQEETAGRGRKGLTEGLASLMAQKDPADAS